MVLPAERVQDEGLGDPEMVHLSEELIGPVKAPGGELEVATDHTVRVQDIRVWQSVPPPKV
jgi:hypothetical protein